MDIQKAKLQAQTLIESLPYLQKFYGKVVVIKYGGSSMNELPLKYSFAHSVSLLKLVGIHPIVVHGGGPQIGAMLSKLDMQSKFYNGLRITDDSDIDIVEMVLVGSINKDIVSQINKIGGRAVGISGKDGSVIHARKKDAVLMNCDQDIKTIDFGHVGHITHIDTSLLNTLIHNGFIPVIAPIGFDGKQTYNINADEVAGAIASTLKATRFLLLTDVEGIIDKHGKLVRSITIDRVHDLFDDGSISGGMIPKVHCCINALNSGVEKVMILDGRLEHAILLELLTEQGVGTEIVGTI